MGKSEIKDGTGGGKETPDHEEVRKLNVTKLIKKVRGEQN